MSDASVKKLHSYIVQKGESASALELLRQVLKIGNANDPIAENIISSLLEHDSRFVKTTDGRWTTAKTCSDAENEWILCKVFPPSADWRRISAVACARWRHEKADDPKFFSKELQSERTANHVLQFMHDAPVIMDGVGAQLSSLRQFILHYLGTGIDNPVFLLPNILKRFYPRAICRTEADISRLLGQPVYEQANIELQFEAFIQQAARAFEFMREKHISTVDELHAFCSFPRFAPEFDSYGFDAAFIEKAPQTPGVYIMKNAAGDVIYVGKAKVLRRRLKSYFAEVEKIDEKLRSIREELYDIELISTGSELEALLLENELIRKHLPKVNKHKDTRNRSFLLKQRFPQILFLPSVDDNAVIILFFNPSRAIETMQAARKGDDRKIRKTIDAVFFAKKSRTYERDKEEIITSWLSKNHAVSRIDMRFVTSVNEAFRLVQAHIKSFTKGETVVHY